MLISESAMKNKMDMQEGIRALLIDKDNKPEYKFKFADLNFDDKAALTNQIGQIRDYVDQNISGGLKNNPYTIDDDRQLFSLDLSSLEVSKI